MKQFIVFTALVLVTATSASGVIVYAPNNLGGSPAGSDNVLISFDSASPQTWTPIGSMGHPGIGFGGLDFSGAGNLYAYASYGTGVTGGLYSVSTVTGAATLIGNSGQLLQDLAWDPVGNRMLGVNAVSNVATIYSVALNTGMTTALGTVTGLPSPNLEVGMAVDAQGTIYLHDVASDRIYKGTAPGSFNVAQMPYVLGDTNFSQGMTIDWSRDNKGYHGAIGNTPAFFSELRSFDTVPGSYTLVNNFGTGPGVFPTVETGDLAIPPIPEPATIGLLAAGGLMLIRRRRA